MKRILLGGLVSLIFSLGTAQEKSPEFRQPMDIPVALSANFGELRANHVHSGLDLKTQQVCGQKVYAVQEGYVSRIHVSATGYGNCLYIDHPSGYTSVYAHLDRFLPFIDSIAKREQYARESFALDYYPEAGSIPVKKGQLIAYSGNSGSSGGPHLHFEIRETATQKAMDPQQFYQIYDNLAPKFKKIRLPCLFLNELRQCETAQLLLCVSASKMVFASIIYGIINGIDFYLNIIKAAFAKSVHADDQSQSGLDLIRDVNHQLINILYANNFPCVINADIDDAAVCVGESANPFEIFVFPG